MNNYSVCCVVRDEEENIEGMINSCISYLDSDDELVIIDGGSKDRTYDIAKWYEGTDRDVKVIKLPQKWAKRKWEDEAEYRNWCWERCKHDWILSLDADEAYDKKVYESLREMIIDNDVLAIYFTTINFYGSTKRIIDPEIFPDYHIRFANRKRFKWVGKIHSSLWLDGKAPISPNHFFAAVSSTPLYHYARVRGEVNREYGVIPKETIEFKGEHPRREYDE